MAYRSTRSNIQKELEEMELSMKIISSANAKHNEFFSFEF